MAEKISPDARTRALAQLEGWEAAKNREAIVKEYRFANFSQAFAWMTQVALLAEKMDHHPEWTNVYSRVSVALTTHDAGGITQNDLDMAKRMDLYAKLYTQK